MHADFLIIGSGIAGIYFAVNAAEKHPDKKIVIVTKGNPGDSNSRLAQGGIASVTAPDDNFEKHFQDTLKAGDFRNVPEIVKILVKETPEHIQRLIGLGVNFDRENKHQYHLTLEGGHSAKRILHHKDATGQEILRVLLKHAKRKNNIRFLPRHYAISLLTDKTQNATLCKGARLYSSEREVCFNMHASVTFLATGGAGQLYLHTTNPAGATGDGIAMAYAAGAKVKDIDLMQFHPTTLYKKGSGQAFLISEAVRGEGAVLRDDKGERFMVRYHSQAELAPRDVVAKALYETINKSDKPYAYLDCRHLNKKAFEKHFPGITTKFQSEGIDFKNDLIPVAPGAHYTCGGIVTNEHGETNIKNLFAGGECAWTGLHGSNRLASNSLSETLVFSYRSLKKAEAAIANPSFPSAAIKEMPIYRPDQQPAGLQIISDIKNIMWHGSGIIKSLRCLQQAEQLLGQLGEILEKTKHQISPSLIEGRNLHLLATLSVKESLARTENTGVFYNKNLDESSFQQLSSLRHSA